MQPLQGYNTQGYRTIGPYSQNQGSEPQFISKAIINTEDIREIVEKLNAKPFDENFTLVTFDELSPASLLQLLNKVMTNIDPQQEVNLKYETQDKSIERITEFLRIMNYPSNFDQQFQNNVLQGDRKTIYPILYYLLKNLPDLRKRAYLAKFLVPINIPPEMLTEDDMKNLYQQYKDLQAEFQVNHQQLEEVQKNALSPGDIQREIKQLERLIFTSQRTPSQNSKHYYKLRIC